MCNCSKKTGTLHVITGPMSSGKSLNLITCVTKEKIAKRKPIIFKPSWDTRNPEGFVESRAGSKIEAITINSVMEFYQHYHEYEDCSLFCFDEVHFYDNEYRSFIDMVNELVNSGKNVICCGLDQDYLGNPFDIIAKLMGIAEKVEKLTAICLICGNEAHMTHKISKGDSRYEVGGDESYHAICRSCHREKNR